MCAYRRPEVSLPPFLDAGGVEIPCDAAPVTFVYTSFPSVIVHMGALHDELYPVCGCDACDEEWTGTADRLEEDVFAVASGGLTESVPRGAAAR